MPPDRLIVPVLVQLAVVIAAARVGGAVARRVGQPAVVGEILAGLALGPSLLGAVWPAGFAALFRPDLAAAGPAFAVLKELGLIFLLFLLGLEFEAGHLRAHGRAAVAVAVSGTAVPFALGAPGWAWPSTRTWGPGRPAGRCRGSG